MVCWLVIAGTEQRSGRGCMYAKTIDQMSMQHYWKLHTAKPAQNSADVRQKCRRVSPPASCIAATQTALATTAFALALVMSWTSGLWRRELCTHPVAKWPVEWVPSVSTIVGDHAVSRAPFHIAQVHHPLEANYVH